MTRSSGEVIFPWLEEPLQQVLSQRNSHAMLLHGPAGVGQFELALAIAQVQLCEAGLRSERPLKPCGACAGCRLLQARTHPDLLVVLPETTREELDWTRNDTASNEPAAAGSTRAKPSKEIRVDDIRAVIAFAQSTSARGGAKIVVIYPAERMNPIASNALLKTLEEPAGVTRFILASSEPDALLPTVRSRCEAFAVHLPRDEQALAWLQTQGVAHAEVLLAACGGRPLDALAWSRDGIDAAAWQRLPSRVAGGDVDSFADWGLPRVVETLQKICHDALCAAVGASPRFFPAESIGDHRSVLVLTAWAAQLRRDATQCEHPWNSSLKVESLVQQAKRAMSGQPSASTVDAQAFVHSAP